MIARLRDRWRERRGQALVEFSLVLIPFLFILMGVFDLGRGIYIHNGVSQAAREIARVTSVYTCNTSSSTCTLGTSPQTAAVIATQRTLVPGLGGPGSSIVFQCTGITDAPRSNTSCASLNDGDPATNDQAFVRVTVQVPFAVITPLLGMVAPSTISSTTHIEIP